jgi:predicted glycosyltransferase
MRYRVADLPDIEAIPRSGRPTALFGIYTVFGYGHLARCHRLAEAFAARTSFDTYIFGTHPTVRLGEDTPRILEVDLPGPVLRAPAEPLDDLPDTADVRGSAPGMSVAGLSALKSRLLLALAQHLEPRVVIVDHFPFAMSTGRDMAECDATLRYLRDTTPATLRCAGYRGRCSRKDEAAQDECRRLVERYLDLLFVYVDPREREDFFDRHPLLRPIEARLRFVGYVAPPRGEEVRRDPTRTRILATCGAGIDGYPSIRLACEAFRILASTRSDLALDVVTGEGLPDGARQELEARYPEVRMTRSRPALWKHLAEYELVFAMGGYNTCTELHQSGTRSVVLPRRSTRRTDQFEFARTFQVYGGIDHVVDRRTTSPETLARLMAACLAAPPARREPVDLGGAGATAELLSAELERRALASPPRTR